MNQAVRRFQTIQAQGRASRRHQPLETSQSSPPGTRGAALCRRSPSHAPDDGGDARTPVRWADALAHVLALATGSRGRLAEENVELYKSRSLVAGPKACA
jgi:hypothetical protein